jgi:hypothetical protein
MICSEMEGVKVWSSWKMERTQEMNQWAFW